MSNAIVKNSSQKSLSILNSFGDNILSFLNNARATLQVHIQLDVFSIPFEDLDMIQKMNRSLTNLSRSSSYHNVRTPNARRERWWFFLVNFLGNQWKRKYGRDSLQEGVRKKLAKREKNGKSHTKVDLRRWMTFYITKTLQLNVMRVDLASSPFFIKKSKKKISFSKITE